MNLESGTASAIRPLWGDDDVPEKTDTKAGTGFMIRGMTAAVAFGVVVAASNIGHANHGHRGHGYHGHHHHHGPRFGLMIAPPPVVVAQPVIAAPPPYPYAVPAYGYPAPAYIAPAPAVYAPAPVGFGLQTRNFSLFLGN
jgi:hypothetical protein